MKIWKALLLAPRGHMTRQQVQHLYTCTPDKSISECVHTSRGTLCHWSSYFIFIHQHNEKKWYTLLQNNISGSSRSKSKSFFNTHKPKMSLPLYDLSVVAARRNTSCFQCFRTYPCMASAFPPGCIWLFRLVFLSFQCLHFVTSAQESDQAVLLKTITVSLTQHVK